MNNEYQSNVIEELNKMLKNFEGIKNYHIDFRLSTSLFGKDKCIIRIWTKKEEYDSYNVLKVLETNETLEQSIKNLLKKINFIAIFDIYYI